MYVWLLFQTKKVTLLRWEQTFFFTVEQFLHLMMTLHSILDSTRFITPC